MDLFKYKIILNVAIMNSVFEHNVQLTEYVVVLPTKSSYRYKRQRNREQSDLIKHVVLWKALRRDDCSIHHFTPLRRLSNAATSKNEVNNHIASFKCRSDFTLRLT